MPCLILESNRAVCLILVSGIGAAAFERPARLEQVVRGRNLFAELGSEQQGTNWFHPDPPPLNTMSTVLKLVAMSNRE